MVGNTVNSTENIESLQHFNLTDFSNIRNELLK